MRVEGMLVRPYMVLFGGKTTTRLAYVGTDLSAVTMKSVGQSGIRSQNSTSPTTMFSKRMMVSTGGTQRPRRTLADVLELVPYHEQLCRSTR